jgi:hypothetical protein
MKGLIFRTELTHRNIERHPHLVLLLSGKQCFVVPGYTPGKPAVTNAINALLALGYPPDKIYVTIDNGKHVKPLTSFTWHTCHWFIAQGYWASKSDFEVLAPDGIMDAEGMHQIVTGTLKLAEEKTELFSPRQIALLKQLIRPT